LSENVEKSGRAEGEGPKGGFVLVRVDRALLRELTALFPEVKGISDTAKVDVLLRKLLMMEEERRSRERDAEKVAERFEAAVKALASARELSAELKRP
jgi:ribose 1,5-bisphosphokinase PhnN